MNKLKNLIKEFCPDGVEFIRFGDCLPRLRRGASNMSTTATNFRLLRRSCHG